MMVTERWNCAKNPAALNCPLFLEPVAAGFPSPAEGFLDKRLDLNELVVRHPEATFFVRVSGHSMTGAQIQSGDILVVDRSIEARDGHVVVAVLDGEFTVKRLYRRNGRLVLQPENRAYRPMPIDLEQGFEVWGVVTHVIHKAA